MFDTGLLDLCFCVSNVPVDVTTARRLQANSAVLPLRHVDYDALGVKAINVPLQVDISRINRNSSSL
jgi:hypothetical protein